ncbi:hypothetical protein [Kineococcus sp. SYSU DK003]|uniref:hypothetical protein n=1 Tax=Kineococcus sp. SYSU DK003 TaxID=3383124 RepID=UPI003D7E09F8
MRFADMGKATLRGGRTYSPAEVALLAAHLDLTEAKLRQVSQWVAQVEWDRARLRSALARTAVAAMNAGVQHDVLHHLVERSGAVSTQVLAAARDHTTDHTTAWPR